MREGAEEAVWVFCGVVERVEIICDARHRGGQSEAGNTADGRIDKATRFDAMKYAEMN